MLDDPPIRPGLCPNCGQEANIWNPPVFRYECSFCDMTWKPGYSNPPKDGRAIAVTVVGARKTA